MSALSAAASDEDGDIIKALQARVANLESQIRSSGDGWYESIAELAAVYGEMCAINETPRKDQTLSQTERLKELRAECVASHYKRITLASSARDIITKVEGEEMIGKILIDRSVVEQALRAFEAWDARGRLRVMAALRSALEQPQVEQEPVAFIQVNRHGEQELVWDKDEDLDGHFYDYKPLYTHPQNLNCKSNQHRLATLCGYEKPQPPRQPLTDEWIRMIYDKCDAETGDEFIFAFARAIERAHEIGCQK